jgi:hypothetical protein
MDSPWLYSTIHNSPCKISEEAELWGKKLSRIWLPGTDEVGLGKTIEAGP